MLFKKSIMRLFLCFFLLLLSNIVFGQGTFGNEWIKDGQKYLRIKVSEDGVYRISYSQLSGAGFLANNPNPKNFQIFYRGIEIPLYIEGETDNLFENGDFIEFSGKRNDGKLDQALYNPSNQQPNPEISLFTDDAYYFLTIGTANGKRYTNTSLAAGSLTSESFISYTASLNLAQNYNPAALLIDQMSLSEYQAAEGYMGNMYAIGTTQSYSLATPNAYSTASLTPTLSYYVAGRSNANSTDPAGNNHHLNVSIGNTVLGDAKFKGYAFTTAVANLTYNLIGNTTSVNFSSINDLGAVTDYQSVAYARITYARGLDGTGIGFLPFKIATNNPEALLNFNNANWNEAYILDEVNQFRYIGSKSGATTSFVVKNTASELVLCNNNGYKTPVVESISMNPIKAASNQAKLLIITHKNLMDGANEYAAYKISKGFNTAIVTTEDLYNQFYYGQHHPLAIKNFVRYLMSGATIRPEYLLLLGKGYELPRLRLDDDLVPTMGYPPSDTYLTSEIVDNTMAPALATGRVPAKTNDDVRTYLNKLKQYDQQDNFIWRKNIINITGGANNSEDISFSGYLKNLSAIADKEYFGAKTINYYKSVTDPVTDNLMAKISGNINDGVSVLNFLGHGSTTTTAVSIGNPSFLNNSNKLLLYIINGCSTGNAFVNGSLGEDYIFQNNKGAIAWFGASSQGLASYLYNYTRLFYQNAFNTNYGGSIAQNMARAARAYQHPSDTWNWAHLRQYVLLGDPTVSLYSPSLPDYEIKNEDIGLQDQNVTVNSPSIKLFTIVKNIGKSTSNNIPVLVTRTLPNNTIHRYPVFSYEKVLNTDTVIIELDNTLPNVAGNNKFTIAIDPENTIEELSKANNTAEFSYLIRSTGITLISPTEFAITNEAAPSLKIQANDIFSKEQQYVFEIDTVKTFNSNWKKTSPNVNGNAFISWKPSALFESGKVYYWRAKQADNQNSDWQSSSFAYMSNISNGWNQSHYQQYDEITLKNIVLNSNSKQLEFTTTAFPVLLRTKGNNSTSNIERRMRMSISVGAIAFHNADFEGLGIAAVDPVTPFNMYSYPSVYNFKNDGVNGTGQFLFDTNNAADVDALNEYLQNIPDGYYVMGFSGRNFNPKSLPQTTQNLLAGLNLNKANTINNGEPYAFWTQKGNHKKITPLELTADYSSSVPADQQSIDFSYDLRYPWDNGSLTSEKIGPASNWSEAIFDFDTQSSDNLTYNVIGINPSGAETMLKSNLTTPTIALTDIAADSYPFLRINVNISDTQNKSVPHLKGWRVVYDPYADIAFNPDIQNTFHSSTVNQGDSVKLAIGYINLEKQVSDSVVVKYKLTKADRSVVNGLIKTNKPLAYNETDKVNFSLSTKDIPGANTLQLSVNSKDNKDKNELNNYAIYNFNVVKDDKEPVIDVFFDNKRIINGEVVSPNPKISISIADENKFLLLNDTTNIELYLKKDDEQAYRRIAFSDNKVVVQNTGTASNNKIDFLYSPNTLADGRYNLKLRGKDASGNYNTSNDYLVDFEVINEQTITNFLPYPNPFTTSMKFVFQVTGKVPDKIKVQIMTVTGKIVREVFKNELGTINIGNNISDFTWDGTDQFGDRLANGVYFYHVILENNDQSDVKHRANSTDVFFKKNFGKIYLMR